MSERTLADRFTVVLEQGPVLARGRGLRQLILLADEEEEEQQFAVCASILDLDRSTYRSYRYLGDDRIWAGSIFDDEVCELIADGWQIAD